MEVRSTSALLAGLFSFYFLIVCTLCRCVIGAFLIQRTSMNIRWRFVTSKLDLNLRYFFPTDHCKAVVLVCQILCVALWLLADWLFCVDAVNCLSIV